MGVVSLQWQTRGAAVEDLATRGRYVLSQKVLLPPSAEHCFSGGFCWGPVFGLVNRNQKSSMALKPKNGTIKNMFWGTDRTKDKGERLELRLAG